MTIEFRDKDWKYLKQWPNVGIPERGIPLRGDHVVLHWGDYGEESEEYVVLRRVFDGMRDDVVVLVVEKYELLRGVLSSL
ncbi:MAG: hypothetical protein IJ190_14360 [Prevotella sp.]|nr:hypothetical protein [Prevotella sp.]